MKKFNGFIACVLALFCLLLGGSAGYYGYLSLNKFSSEVYVSGDLQIHFLELGNVYTGDCTYIKAGDTDILIDAGSRTDSIPTITSYINQFVTDGKLEYVIVTHAHEDHYAGFATNENVDSIFDLYECGVIIDFARTNQKDTGKLYSNYIRERDAEVAEGAVHYTARECIENDKDVFDLGAGVTMTILDQRYYYEDASSENDYSVCTLITHGDRNFLFTGDLEEKGELSLIEKNTLPEVEVYKAGHHGSKTSSSPELMEAIKPKVVCVCCCAGSAEYTDKVENQFPTQIFIDNVAPYTDAVYVTTLCTKWESGEGGKEFTSMNGNITIVSGINGISLSFSADSKKLKDTEWFKEYRLCPDAWK